MALSENEVNKLLQTPTKRGQIAKILKYQDRLRFHTQCRTDQTHTGGSLAEFLLWVESLLPSDKFKTFKSLLRFPLRTNSTTAQIYDKLSRVFDGRNPAFNYQFMKSEYRDYWEWYRQEKLGEPHIWGTMGWENFKAQINSVLIVDLPATKESEEKFASPYFYWLPISSVIDYKVSDDTTGQMEYIIFSAKRKLDDDAIVDVICVYDNKSYRTYESLDNGKKLGKLLTSPEHDLGYCPARFFWAESLDVNEPDIKASPIASQLGALDELLKAHTELQHLKLYASYPIYSGYSQACGYLTTDHYCKNGKLVSNDGSGIVGNCPVCGEKRIVGPGSYIEVPVPIEGSPDLRNPVQILPADISSLAFAVEEIDRVEQSIISACVGAGTQMLNQEAVNELQVGASFESQSGALNRTKRGLEMAQQWVGSTCCLLMFGTGFISASVNYGTDFYLLTSDTLRKRYQTAKDGGASEAELDALHTQILETDHRTDQLLLQRMLILAELEPYRHFSRTEVLSLYDRGLISADDLELKLNFATFVRRFERENYNIIEFGEKLSYDNKIIAITKKLKEYGTELRKGRSATDAERD